MKNEFSLLRAIAQRVENRTFDDLAIEIINAGKAEMRKSGITSQGDIVLPTEYRADIVAGTAGAGQEIVGEEKMNILAPLRESLVLVKAGASFITGLTGDVSIPSYGGTSALWKGEIESAEDGAGEFDEITLSPKRITAFIDISKQFLAQDSVAAETMLKQDIVNAVVSKLEGTIFGKEAGSATMPAGFFAVAPDISGAVSWENIVAMETAVDTTNALMGNLKYVCNASARGILKSTEKSAGTGRYLVESGSELNGYPLLVTNHVASGLQVGTDEDGILFGNFADFVVGQWGGIDITVDPFTVAKEGKVRLVVNSYWDAAPRRAVSFKTASLK